MIIIIIIIIVIIIVIIIISSSSSGSSNMIIPPPCLPASSPARLPLAQQPPGADGTEIRAEIRAHRKQTEIPPQKSEHRPPDSWMQYRPWLKTGAEAGGEGKMPCRVENLALWQARIRREPPRGESHSVLDIPSQTHESQRTMFLATLSEKSSII